MNNPISFVNDLIQKAISLRASDLHCEPTENGIRIRYRIDGLLQDGETISKQLAPFITSRIKIMVGLDIAEHRIPQDGRTNFGHIDLRVSSLPLVHGEKIVIRLLDRKKLVVGLDELGMSEENLATYKSLIKKPQGIVLITGPTGSGKTTTLYSSLSYINCSQINIMTIEDPIEYKLPQINQIQVNPRAGLTFASGLRGILRQDPDVIMLGEIRDKESARIAVQAALTGHLVLATLHTNDSLSAITRLADIGVESYLILSTLNGVVAQRLIRILCKSCKGKGCASCNQTGYFGRTGIFEILTFTPDKNTITSRSLYQDGLEKADKGITTKEEIARVCLCSA